MSDFTLEQHLANHIWFELMKLVSRVTPQKSLTKKFTLKWKKNGLKKLPEQLLVIIESVCQTIEENFYEPTNCGVKFEIEDEGKILATVSMWACASRNAPIVWENKENTELIKKYSLKF
jgi:hypothetical protein